MITETDSAAVDGNALAADLDGELAKTFKAIGDITERPARPAATPPSRLFSDRRPANGQARPAPAHMRLAKTLDEAHAVCRLARELATDITGSAPEGHNAPKPHTHPGGLFGAIDATAADIEAELAATIAAIEHIRRGL